MTGRITVLHCPACGYGIIKITAEGFQCSKCFYIWTEPTKHVPESRYYTEGRRIEPLDVIEDWNLPHHLACVVKYIARFGRKEGEGLEGLQKAQYYLERFIVKQ